MKRGWKLFLSLTLAATLVLATALPALAIWGTLYVNKSKLKIYELDDTSSHVIKTVKGGTELTVSALSPDGKWAQLSLDEGIGFAQMKYLSKEFPQDYCDHSWYPWNVTKEPTCTKNGKRERSCPVCGKVQTQEIKKLGHDWSKWKVIKEATCYREGTRVRTCATCGEEQKESFLEEHTYGAWSLTLEPTCSREGERLRTCRICGYDQIQTLDTLPHDYEYRVTTLATDHSSGVRSKICTVCGQNGGKESFDPEGTLRRKDRGDAVRAVQQLLVDQGYLNAGGADGVFGGGTEKAIMQFQKDQGLEPDGVAWPQTIKRLSHDYGPWTTVREMTRTSAGERVRTCKDCGHEQRETVEPGEVFEKGRRGEPIRALQQIIKQTGYDAGSADGIYGKKLDAALAAFARDNGFEVETGKVRPADVDALMNAWLGLQADRDWKGEGDADSAVSLALTVTETDPADESGIAGYTWSLTNLGGEKVMFNALLLAFGEDPDFRKDVLVMALDGVELKPGAKNSASGSFVADRDWGSGDMHFAALAVSDKTGAKWLSNTVTFEDEDASASRVIAPMAEELDVTRLPDGTYPVSFDRGDVYKGASGTFMNGVHIYTMDWYDIVDVNTLKLGDVVVVEGEEVPVLALDTTDVITVNDGQDARAFEFISEEDTNGFRLQGFNGLAAYTDHGVTTLTLDPDATFSDGWEYDSEPLVVTYDGIARAMKTSENDYFVQYNTTVRIENGKVVEIKRVYVP